MSNISLNFGALKESILKLSSRNFINESRNDVTQFADYIKNNEILKKQHLAYKSLADTKKKFGKERLAERFLNQTLQLFDGVSWNDILEENRKLRLEFLDNTHVGSTTNRDNLFNSIQTLIEARCKRNYKDIEKEQEAYENVVNHLMAEKNEKNQIKEEEEKEDHPPLASWKYVTKLAYNNFNKRYGHLSESERSLLNILLSPYDKKVNYLKDLKEESINNINENINKSGSDEEIGVLNEFKEKVKKIDPDKEEPQKLDEAIISCFDLKEDINKE